MTFIKGSLCELRVLEMSDYEAETFTNAVNAGLTTQHLFTGSIPMRSVDYKERWKKEREAGDILFGIWVLCLQPHDHHKDRCDIRRFIGTCGLHSHREIYRSWEARWLIFDPEAVGKGIGKETVLMMTRYAFERLNAHRVWLGVNADNKRAVKCYIDCGYKFEGTLRDEIFCYSKYHDAIRMGILEEEWKSIVSSS